MSELQTLSTNIYPPLTQEQSKAMARFLKNYYNASLYLVLLAMFILLITVVLDWATHNFMLWIAEGMIGASIVSIVAALYFVALVTVIWRRTGLKWYVVGENLQGLGAGILVIISLFYYFVLPLELRYSVVTFFFLLMVAIMLPRVLQSVLAQRLKQYVLTERHEFGQHWITLGTLSFADVLFLRIPTIKSK
jgi:hypothetical protein